MPRGQGHNTPTRPIRVDPDLWNQFGQVVQDEGTDRSTDIRRYMTRRVAEHTRTVRREDERSLWLNIAMAAKVVANPNEVINRARRRLQELREAHSHGRSDQWFDRWEEILNEGPHAVLAVMTGRSDEAQALRSTSPIPGDLLGEEERAQVLAAFRAHWRSAHGKRAA